MKRHIKIIPHPKLDSARQLSPMELNKIRFSQKRTILTPAILDKFASQASASDEVRQKSENDNVAIVR